MAVSADSRDDSLAALSRSLGESAQAAGVMVAAAESCTGGWLAKVITDIPGSSRWFDRGFVTYTNEAKQDMLGVPAELLAQQGAVSEATVTAMAEGALTRSRAGISVAISGIAGPGGDTPDKPLGMVCFAWAYRGQATRTDTYYYNGDREAVRRQAVAQALTGLLDMLSA